jgi:hypothetical protein
MQGMSSAEKQTRLQAVQSVIGTHAMEGIVLDSHVRTLMDRFAEGDISLEEFSSAMNDHARQVLAMSRQLAGAA